MSRYTKSSGRCEKCNKWRKIRHRDHKKPKALGGSENRCNIQWLCANCHEDKTQDDWMRPAFRAKRSADMEACWRRPSYRKKMPHKDPKWRNNQRKATKAKWRDPAFRAKQIASRNSTEHRRILKRNKKLRSELAKLKWKDPVYRAKQRASRIKMWKRSSYRVRQNIRKAR